MVVAAEVSPINSMTIGASYLRMDGDGSVRSTPFVLEHAPGTWTLRLLGDGYSRVGAGADAASGWSDVSLFVARRYAIAEDWILMPHVQLTLPSRSDAGSEHASQDVGLLSIHPISNSLTLLGAAVLVRGGPPEVGASRYAKVGLAGARYAWTDATFAVLMFRRSLTRGAGDTAANLELDFPVYHRIGGILTASRGLTPGSRHRAIQFDLVFPF
ncbi:hypothetical protein HLB44_31555 [Aquincola sp. S2]|uniref:Cellulose biosynthesis protein BcsS n=1 Tax=Pseudaquabacterium terrae TaxID=2732868 RepID=A0ABX2ESL6_9BURK|nr:hypothetical protein [Aquabacterium terrae]NRF71534.1 hypothetical protein [Aquabacterium terrae]